MGISWLYFRYCLSLSNFCFGRENVLSLGLWKIETFWKAFFQLLEKFLNYLRNANSITYRDIGSHMFVSQLLQKFLNYL